MTTVKYAAKHREASRSITPLTNLTDSAQFGRVAARSAATMTATGLALTVASIANAAPIPQVDSDTDPITAELVAKSQNSGIGTIVSVDAAWDSAEEFGASVEAPPEPEVEEEAEVEVAALETDGTGYQQDAPQATAVPAVDNSSVAAAAASLTGIPYVWGGESYAGLDCSGLVKMAYAAVGISLPHQSDAIRNSGVTIPSSEAQPGDVIWYPGHVAVYVGDGMMAEATVPGSLSSVNPVRAGGTYVRIG